MTFNELFLIGLKSAKVRQDFPLAGSKNWTEHGPKRKLLSNFLYITAIRPNYIAHSGYKTSPFWARRIVRIGPTV